MQHGKRLAELAEAAVPGQPSGKSSKIKDQITTCSSMGKISDVNRYLLTETDKAKQQTKSVHEERMEQQHDAMRTVGCFSYVSTERMVPAMPGVNLGDIQ